MKKYLSIRPEVTKHALAYTILVLGLSMIMFLFFAVWPNRIAQRYVILVLSSFYLFWGVIAHVKTEHLTLRVIAEYSAVSILGGMLLFFVTL